MPAQLKFAAECAEAEAGEMVRDIVTHHLVAAGILPSDENPNIHRVGGGLTNLVFCVESHGGGFIVRLGPHPDKINDFLKEQWAIARAREAGVPTPEVLEVGNRAATLPYMISRQSRGTEATFHPRRIEIIEQMGHYAAMINSIGTNGFGSSFDWSQNQLSHNATWSDFLECELKMEEKLRTLESSGVLDTQRIRKLRTVLEGFAGRGRLPQLNHGDMRPKNVLADDEGEITCILDWEHSISIPAPEWELAIALHDLSIDEKQRFLKGYGLTEQQISDISPVIKAINLINYASVVEHAANSKHPEKLERYRARLRGDLDLYSL